MVLAGTFAACSSSGPITGGVTDPGNDGFDPGMPEPPDPVFDPGTSGHACNPNLSVTSDGPALLVNDPAVLERFSLERVLQQLIDTSPEPNKTPEELLKRLFDTQNTTAGAVFPDNPHCDSPDNTAFKNGPAVDCPRAEGALAKSPGLFDPAHPDYFVPVALVNRMDLMPQGLTTCGEFRIVFAKASGRTNPNDRVFLIFEGALENPIFALEGCMPVASLWASLEKETEPEAIAAKLEAFYFTGIPGFKPLVHPDNLGIIGGEDDPYGATRGQIRLSQHMQDPWDLREFRVTGAGGGAPFYFRPVTVKNNPLPKLFDTSVTTPAAQEFRMNFLVTDVYTLGSTHDLGKMRMRTLNTFNAGQSALAGPAATNYMIQAKIAGGVPAMTSDIATQLTSMGLGGECPPSDPLDAQAIVARASVQTCAGCHAPAQFIGAERRLGGGVTIPNTHRPAPKDENGTISPALEEVFLPRRAAVMSQYLQFCDTAAIWNDLEPGGGVPVN
jgi:hypothetical protein